jgi:hypothetical protein
MLSESVAAPQEKLCHLEFVYTNLIYEICALLGYYGVYGDNSEPTFRDKRSVSSSRVKKSKKPEIVQAKCTFP